MTYQEAIEYREKNLHLIGKEYMARSIKEIFVYPLDEEYGQEFFGSLNSNEFDPIQTASIYGSDFGLRILLDGFYPTDLFHLDLNELPVEFGVILPESY
ncbi:hypothetical protein, partial [uncultured Algoriphagus sp.]|uniref:hypothetical protein n=1 Tax=uncultured Algoriphagus sp. TaxID=417365 RepID=UPI0030EEA86A